MATQICPKCKNDSFTWYNEDEKDDRITTWFCGACKYTASEDVYFETTCEDCNTKTKFKLKDAENEYFWCSKCNKIS